LNEIKNNIDSIKITVLYHGGEPLLNSLFYEMVAKIKNIKPSIFIKSVTNGTTLNKSNAIRLVKSRRKLFDIPVIQTSTS
jgi:sulfatase maturation enzyme AslB (radical SAM superfamily)